MRKFIALITTIAILAFALPVNAASNLKVPVSLVPYNVWDGTKYVEYTSGNTLVPLEALDALSLSLAANSSVISDNVKIDNNYSYVEVDATSKNITLTFKSIASFPVNKVLVIKKNDSSINTVTLVSADLINTYATRIISNQNDLYYLVSDGKTWTGTLVSGVAAAVGKVTGPSSAINNDVAVFDGTTGKIIKDSGILLSSLVPKTTTVNGQALSGNVSLSASDVGLGNVNNTSDANKPISTAQQTALNLKVDANPAIVSSTKTKVTYDTKGLVTAGVDATTADIADSTDKRYCTDAQKIVIGNTSGTNTGDQTNITGNAGTVTGLSVTAGKTLTVSKTITLTSPDDTSIATLPSGTSTLLATNGSGSSLTGITATQIGLGNVTNDAQVKQSNLQAQGTIVAPGTTGGQTINKPCGRVNIAAAGTTITVTNNLVTANSIILAVAATADTTARVTSVVAGAGSFVINTAAVTAETAFNFIVVNPL